MANGSAPNGHLDNKPVLIPNGGHTMSTCIAESPLANGVANGHITPVQESPFIGYIIAMHRKMVRMQMTNALYIVNAMHDIIPSGCNLTVALLQVLRCRYFFQYK